MLSLLRRAAEQNVGVPSLRSTDYINTIPPEHEPWFPGDEDDRAPHPRRTRAGTPRSWCTARSGPASASAATSRRTPRPRRSTRSGFNHFFRGKDHPGGGDQIFFQGHASPGMYARAFLEGRVSTEHQLDGFRQELSHPGGGAVVVPAPAAHAGVLGVPDRVDGPRPAQRDLPGAVQQVPARPRHQGHQRPARVGVPRRRRDGRGREPRRAAARGARGARQPHLRRQLQPAAPRRTGARQRQDHPGARVLLPRRRLERHQGRLGPQVGRAARARPRRRARQPHEQHARRRLPDLQGRGRRVRPRALLRPRPAHPQAGRGLDRRGDLGAAARRPRLPQDVRRLPRGHRAQGPADRHPREDHQGLDARQPLRGPQRHPPDEEADPRGPQGASATRCRSRSPTPSSRRPVPAAVLPPRPGPRAHRSTCSSAAARSAASCPSGASTASRWCCPATTVYDVVKRGSGKQAVATTMAFVRLLKDLMRDPEIGHAHRADHPRRGAHVRHGLVVPDGEDLLAARPDSTPRSTAS